MVRAQSIKGSRQDILKAIHQSEGDIVEAILFVDDHVPAAVEEGDIEPPTVAVANVDDSREALYTRQADE
jgi:hypothetical protein